MPLEISKFIKDLHAGFQILNLKNDVLRRRSDGIKYRVSGFAAATPRLIECRSRRWRTLCTTCR
jgi:hypothetical protein